MSPEFNEKMQWARYLQHEHDDARIKERARMARIEEEPTKITLYADDEPYQVIDLKDIGDMSEEEYNDKLKDAWLRKAHCETLEEYQLAKYMNYEVEEQEEKPKDETDWSEIVLGLATIGFFGTLIGLLIYSIVKVVNGG